MNKIGIKQTDPSEKKMIRGSFAVSLLVHSLILLLIGSIVIVPGVVKEMNRITTVAPPPVDIPPPPPVVEQPDVSQDDPGGSPITDVQPAPAASPTENSVDALTLASPVKTGPSLNAMPGASTVAVDAFTSGKGGFSGGTGIGVGKGTGTSTFFGSREKQEGTLIGRLYDFKQDRSRRGIPCDSGKIIKSFIQAGFSPSVLSKFYISPTPLYASHIFFPMMKAEEGPKAFNVEKEVRPVNFMVHYTGMVAPSTDITMRFCGYGDDWLVVAIDNKIVLDGSWATGPKHEFFGWKLPEQGKTPFNEPTVFLFPGAIFTRGDWFEWKADDFKKMDVVWCESGGGVSSLGLYVEIKGRTYKTGRDGVPEYPLFRLSSEHIKIPDKSGPYHVFDSSGIVFKVKAKQE